MTDSERCLEEMGRAILYETTLSIPNGARFTYRVIGELRQSDCDFLIHFFELLKASLTEKGAK